MFVPYLDPKFHGTGDQTSFFPLRNLVIYEDLEVVNLSLMCNIFFSE